MNPYLIPALTITCIAVPAALFLLYALCAIASQADEAMEQEMIDKFIDDAFRDTPHLPDGRVIGSDEAYRKWNARMDEHIESQRNGE